MQPAIAIDGSGVAACCCAQLLRAKGFAVATTPARNTTGPVLLLSNQTQSLLHDVFPGKGLFQNAVPVRRRIVLWGAHASVVTLPHSGVVVAEAALLSALSSSTDKVHVPSWQVFASRINPQSESRNFGTRLASVSTIRFLPEAPADACWVESVRDGWLFLLPCGERLGSLIAVGDCPSRLLAQSRLIADQIAQVEPSTRSFPAYPRAATPMCGRGWISCGSAALSFDPICGEGAGNAVREAILASAVIEAAAKGFDVDGLLALYSTRLLHAFGRHLALCRDFYRSAGEGDWWHSELRALENGIAWLQDYLRASPPPTYRLAGFELQPVA